MNDLKWYRTYQKLKKRDNITDYRVAKQLHMSRSAIAEWKDDGRYPSVSTLIALANLFEVPISEFFD